MRQHDAITWGPYLVRQDPTDPGHAIVMRLDDLPADPTWQELQHLKTLVWGSHARAVEVYPEAPNVLDTANMRHLWRVPDVMRTPCLATGGRKWEWLA